MVSVNVGLVRCPKCHRDIAVTGGLGQKIAYFIGFLRWMPSYRSLPAQFWCRKCDTKIDKATMKAVE